MVQENTRQWPKSESDSDILVCQNFWTPIYICSSVAVLQFIWSGLSTLLWNVRIWSIKITRIHCCLENGIRLFHKFLLESRAKTINCHSHTEYMEFGTQRNIPVSFRILCRKEMECTTISSQIDRTDPFPREMIGRQDQLTVHTSWWREARTADVCPRTRKP